MSIRKSICEQCSGEYVKVRTKKRCNACLESMTPAEWYRFKTESKNEWNLTEDWKGREARWSEMKRELRGIRDRAVWRAILSRRAEELFGDTEKMEWFRERKHVLKNEILNRDRVKAASTKDMPYDI